MRYILRLTLALLLFLALSAIPWPSFQEALSVLGTPPLSTLDCPAQPPTPNYYLGGGETAAIAAINHAHAREGLPALALPSNYWQLAAPQQQFILVNLERSVRGLTALRWDATLAQIATAYSHQMVNLHFFAHTSPISGDFQDRLNANPQIANHYQSIGENLAGNWAPVAGAMYEYLYNDAEEHCAHRLNILNPHFTFIGIGMVQGGPWGVISVQELLAPNPANPYVGASPDTTPPTIKLSSVLSAASTRLALSAITRDNQGIARITWYFDQQSDPLQQGTDVMLDAHMLTPGVHHLTVYAVDDSQNYTTATLSVTVGAGTITLQK